jgi:citrate lyase subunit beta/citryl-CoA lyase
MKQSSRRSWLIVPALQAKGPDEAARSQADVVVLDVFELVAERDRDAARSALRGAVERAASGGAEVFVQIAAVEADVSAAAWPGVAGVIVARAESPADIAAIACSLSRFESERGVRAGSIEIVPAVETARGNHAAYEIATADPRVSAITLGRAELVMDLRPEPSGEIHLMSYLMQRLVVVAGAAGVTPLGAWWRAPDRGLLATPANTFEAARRGRAIGFKGAMCLRAEQVDALNRGFAAHAAAADRGALQGATA